MKFQDYRTLFIAASLAFALLAAYPALSIVATFPKSGEKFSELWLLDSNHLAENYPFNVRIGEQYSVYLGLGNHMGDSMYYAIYVKFRNQTQSAPNSFNRTSSSLPSLFNITAFVADEGVWELPLIFSFDYDYNENLSKVEFQKMTLNDVDLDISSCTITWNSKTNSFLGNLFFELWIYNATTSSFRYHERSVGLRLNMTSS